MSFDAAERNKLFDAFDQGADVLKAALAKVPEEALKWRPGPSKWSAHEVVWHCADAEMCTAARIRYLACDKAPIVPSYDEAAWAVVLDYQNLPLGAAVEQMTVVRRNTGMLIRRLPEVAWKTEGWHTLHGRFTAENWLRYYAEHLQVHARQIARNV